ncbi:Early nodulin-like protein [Melia azedarach]|uniref:Early nodulin-like protein n=1 Tax=Melia azedarach TaxID=155640 RepID=A0ACC1XDU4_MELAZ|nr:Early nodulin-like protein [Melia azedarach]
MVSVRFLFLILALWCLLFTFSEAREILVGGKENSWTIPPSANFFNMWAEKIRFRKGDFLLWKYDGKTDSVLEVTKEHYDNCKTSKPIKEYKDGDTKIELSRSGPHYFISGAKEHCQKGQKVLVVVLPEKHKSPDGGKPPASAPAPSPDPNSAAYGSRVGFVSAIITLVGLGYAFF